MQLTLLKNYNFIIRRMENLFNVEIIYAKNFNLTYILATGKLFHFAHPLASYKL